MTTETKLSTYSTVTSVAAGDKFPLIQGGANHNIAASDLANQLVTLANNDVLVFLATGQSEIHNALPFVWSPNANAKKWNWSGVDSTIGTAFVALDGVNCNPAERFASEVARLRPKTLVYIINISIGSQPISQWMAGASAPDMFQNILNNIGPALGAIGKSTIDGMLWWQGTSPTAAPGDYADNFETVMGRFFGQTWFPRQTPVMVFTVAPVEVTGTNAFWAFQNATNGQLRKAVRRDQGCRRLVDTSALTDPSFWDGTVHPSGLGAFVMGSMAASTYTLAGAANNAEESLSGLIRVNALPRMGFRNLCYGGDFTKNPWQRGTTFTGAINTQRVADGWRWNQSGAGVIDLKKVADHPTAAQAGFYGSQCLSIDVTTADNSLASTDLYTLRTYIEGTEIAHLGFGQAGTRWLTASFWVKSAVAGNIPVGFRNAAGTRCYQTYFVVNATNTWERKKLTIPVDTGGTWVTDDGAGTPAAAAGLVMSFGLGLGSNFIFDTFNKGVWTVTATELIAGATPSSLVNIMAATGTGRFRIAAVEINEGADGGEFEQLPEYAVVTRCERYLEKSFELGTVAAQNTSNLAGAEEVVAPVNSQLFVKHVRFRNRKRLAPSITTYNPFAANANWRDTTAAADVTVAIFQTTTSSTLLQGTAGAAGAGHEHFIHWQVDSELTYT